MNLLEFIRILSRNVRWLILFPLVVGILVYLATQDLPKEYSSSTIIYTGIASGYNITSEEEGRVDYFAVNNAFDNLMTTVKARETLEEVILSLMANHIVIKQPDPSIVNLNSLNNLRDLIPDSLYRPLNNIGDAQLVKKELRYILNATPKNIISDIVNGEADFYSIKKVSSTLGVTRKDNSDMLELSYRCTDPGVCKQTLDLLSSTFIQRHKSIKGTETGSVVDYFQTQLNDARSTMSDAENRLKEFMVQNRIINYNEQSKYVAETKELIDQELNKEKMTLEASKAALASLESRMEGRAEYLANNKEIQKVQDELRSVNTKLSYAQIYQGSKSQTVDSLTKRKAQLTERFKQLATTYYNQNYTLEAAPQVELLRGWLDRILALEESKGRLKVFEERKNEYDKQYDQFAPWGSTISRLEREVKVAEQHYLSVLNGLNMANLRKQNLELANNLTIVDPPYLPLKAAKSKRPLFIGVAIFAALLITVTVLAARELLDNSIKTPSRAVELTGLKLFGALPYMDLSEKRIDLDGVEKAMLEQINSNFFVEMDYVTGTKIILVTSNLKNEGKSWFMQKIYEEMESIGHRCLFVIPQETIDEELLIWDNLRQYMVEKDFVHAETPADIIGDEDLEQYDFVFIELPNLNHYSIPHKLVQSADMCLHVLNSQRVWSESDANILGLFTKAEPKKHLLMLNAVTAERLESLIGEIPKKRSYIRQLLHNWLYASFQKSKLRSF